MLPFINKNNTFAGTTEYVEIPIISSFVGFSAVKKARAVSPGISFISLCTGLNIQFNLSEVDEANSIFIGLWFLSGFISSWVNFPINFTGVPSNPNNNIKLYMNLYSYTILDIMVQLSN